MRLQYVAFFLAVVACGIAHVAILHSVVRRRSAAHASPASPVLEVAR